MGKASKPTALWPWSSASSIATATFWHKSQMLIISETVGDRVILNKFCTLWVLKKT